MLKIYLGNMEKAIYHPPTYFDNQYEDEWITKELSIRMIKEVDKSDVINSSLIQSPVLGTISVDCNVVKQVQSLPVLRRLPFQ